MKVGSVRLYIFAFAISIISYDCMTNMMAMYSQLVSSTCVGRQQDFSGGLAPPESMFQYYQRRVRPARLVAKDTVARAHLMIASLLSNVGT